MSRGMEAKLGWLYECEVAVCCNTFSYVHTRCILGVLWFFMQYLRSDKQLTSQKPNQQ